MFSELTYKIASFSEIPNFNSDESIDWAIEMLSLGYESENLLFLAGLSKPSNYFEVVKYIKRSLTDLKISLRFGEEAIISYSAYYITKISRSENVENNLAMVYKYCQEKEYEKSIFDFYLLHWAWDDIKYGLDQNAYWPEANKHNVENLVIEKAKNWILENKELINFH